MFIKEKQKELGFSLIELMVVVAIIGILAAIAVPNYQAFQRKSRQSEAKTTLAAMYTAQKAYIVEYSGANTNLDAIGYAPEGRIWYHCGWDAAVQPTTDLGMYSGDTHTGDACVAPCIDNGTGGTTNGVANVDNPIFTIVCGGQIGGMDEDQWQIDASKQLSNIQNGVLQ